MCLCKVVAPFAPFGCLHFLHASNEWFMQYCLIRADR